MGLKEMKIFVVGTEDYEIMDEKSRPVKNIAEMKALENLKAGNIIRTIGYYSANDGGGATYLIREKVETDIEDNGAIHFINDTLVAELILKEGTCNILQFGAKGDGVTDDTQAIINALKYCNTVYLPKKSFLVTSIIELAWGKSIIGDDGKTTIIVNNNSFVHINGRNQIKNLNFHSTINTKDSTEVIETPSLITGTMSYSLIDNINIGLCYIGIDVNISGGSRIKNIDGLPLKYGIKLDNSLDVSYIDNVHFNQNYYGQVSTQLKAHIFENAYALYIGRADWGYVNNIFVFGYRGICYTTAGPNGGSANNFKFNNWGADGCKSLFKFVHNAGGFEFINGNGTFFNPWETEITEAGLTPAQAEQYPININLSASGEYETKSFIFKNNNIFRADHNLILIQGETNAIIDGNTIKNCHTKSAKTSVSPVMYLGGKTIVTNNILNNKTDVGEKQGIYLENANIVCANNIIIGYNQDIPNPGSSTYISNNNTVA